MLKDLLNTVSSGYNFMCAVSLKGLYTNYTSMIFSVMYVHPGENKKKAD